MCPHVREQDRHRADGREQLAQTPQFLRHRRHLHVPSSCGTQEEASGTIPPWMVACEFGSEEL